MKRPNVPCKGCEERKVGCHGKCEKYQTFVEDNEKIKAERQRQHEEDYIATFYVAERRKKKRR